MISRRRGGPRLDEVQTAALRYLTRRNRTEAQLRGYLERHGASSSSIHRLISRFRQLGYLNDAAYARQWARNRLQRRSIGRERLEAELTAQGFQPSTVADTVRELYDEVSERERAERLVAAKGLGPDALRRRGFSEEIVAVVCRLDDLLVEPPPRRRLSRRSR